MSTKLWPVQLCTCNEGPALQEHALSRLKLCNMCLRVSRASPQASVFVSAFRHLRVVKDESVCACQKITESCASAIWTLVQTRAKWRSSSFTNIPAIAAYYDHYKTIR